MMTREEMCEAIQQVDMLLEQLSDLHPKFCDWEAIKRARANLANVLAALEAVPPCACGGKKPFDVWDGWLGGNQGGGYPLAKTRYYASDVPVRVIVLKLPVLPVKEEVMR